MIRCIPLFAMAALLFASPSAQAQNSLQDFQKKVDDALPKGRLIKKWRDELRGSRNEDDQKKEAAKKAAEQERESAGQRRPTLANSDQRAANLNRSQHEQEEPAHSAFREPQPQMSLSPRNKTPSTQQPKAPDFVDPRGRPFNRRQAAVDSDPNKPVGFGLLLDEKKNELVAVEVEPTGNAFAAGIRRGDVIKKLGGVTITTVAEFDEVAGVMKNGDQIEFSVARKGKTDDFPVTFGQLDPAEAAAVDETKDTVNPTNTQPGEFSDFAPPIFSKPQTQDGQLHSVLDNQKQLSSQPIASISKSEKQDLEKIIREQQGTIDRLKKEIETLRNSSRNKNHDPPLGT